MTTSTQTPAVAEIKCTPCGHCDFSSGSRGMDRCGKCDGTGSVFVVGNRRFPNTRDGYEKALEADRARLSQEIETLRRERDQWEEAYRKLGRNQYEHPWTVNEAARLKASLAAAQEQIATMADLIQLRILALADGKPSPRKEFAADELCFVLRCLPALTSPAGGGEPVDADTDDEGVVITVPVWLMEAISQYPLGASYAIEHDGFTGTVIGYYQRRDGKLGVVLQQDGTNIVHVYGEKWLKPAAAAPAPVEAGHWVTVRVEDTCDGLMINADDARRWNLEADRHYPGHFLPDGRYRILRAAVPHLGVREG